MDRDGRATFGPSAPVSNFPIPGLNQESGGFAPYHFNTFSQLPLSIRLVCVNRFNSTVEQAEGASPARTGLFRQLTNLVAGATPNTSITFNSANNFLLPEGFYNVARSQGADAAASEFVLNINSRKTNYTTQPANLPGNIPLRQSDFIFEYFENESSYERAYVSTEFLSSSLHYTLLENIRKVHSNRIIYNSIKYTPYAKKDWGGLNNSICNKNPMQSLGVTNAYFNPMITGLNENESVNMNTNLVFTAQFEEKALNVYRTNRFITCSAFNNQSQLTTRDSKMLWSELERSYGEDIILSYFPLIRLVPAFSRGNVVQTTDTVFFRGLVSNAGGEFGF